MKRFLLLALAAGLLGATSVRAANPMVEIDTSLGKIKVELDQEKAPVSVKNFLSYVDDKFYDDTIYHRVMPRFMIQGGGFNKDREEKKTKASITNEAGNGLKNSRGTIAMARTMDPDSASSQFYINHKDNPSLDRENAQDQVGYAVFGKVIDGLDVVDKIAAVATGTKSFIVKSGQKANFQNVPLDEVVIKSIRRVEK